MDCLPLATVTKNDWIVGKQNYTCWEAGALFISVPIKSMQKYHLPSHYTPIYLKIYIYTVSSQGSHI